MDIFHILMLLVILILSYVIYNQDRKNKTYQKIVDNYDLMMVNIRQYMNRALEKLYSIDSNHIFEGDDDVGWFFSSLKSFLIELNNNIAKIANEETEENSTSQENTKEK